MVKSGGTQLRGERKTGGIVYKQPIDAAQAWFAWGPPFTGDDAVELIRTATEKCGEAKSFELCQSRGGRTVLGLEISPTASKHAAPSPSAPHGVWIVARQHAWESGGSWVCRGLVQWLVSDDPRAVSLRGKAAFHIVPVMDIDNVTVGAGGKEEKPQDHNRDWTDEPYHPAVAAAQREILRENSAGKFDLFIDLHNPGPGDRSSFFFISPRSILSDAGWTNIQTFLQVAQAEMIGPLPVRGPARESGPGYDARWRQIGKNWVTEHTDGHVVSVTLETAWNTSDGTTDGYLTTGKQLGLAIERYFRDPSKRPTTE